MKTENIITLLKTFAKYDCYADLYWNENLEFYVNCNDVFSWATADAEEIIDETLPVLIKAFEECPENGATLYCCRVRKIRPQGAIYEYIDKKFWGLFDDCGPEREINPLNPHNKEEYE